jgi:hypothetical protein
MARSFGENILKPHPEGTLSVKTEFFNIPGMSNIEL